MNEHISNHFGNLTKTTRVWAIGSIHGQSDSLKSLHNQLRKNFLPNDQIVYLGNVLGIGSNIYETIEELLIFRREILAFNTFKGNCQAAENFIFLRGAQEEMWHKLLQVQLSINPIEILEWVKIQGVDSTVEAYGGSIEEGINSARGGARQLARWTNGIRDNISQRPGHREFLSSLKRAAVTDNGSLLFVNSGIDPNRPLDAQRDSFWWDTKGFEELSSPFCGFKKIVRGFSENHPGIQNGEYTVTIDGGAGYGGKLMAACINARGEVTTCLEV